MWVDVKVKGIIYAINALYRPSTQTSSADYDTFLTTAEDIMTKLSDHTADNRIFMSNMNFGNCYSKNPILTPKPLDDRAPELFQGFGYTQVIDIPTQVIDNCTSLLDLVFVSFMDKITCHGTIPKIADHEGTFISFNCIQDKPRPRTRTIFDYNNMDEDALCHQINSLNFDLLVFSQPVSRQAELFTTILTDAFSKFVPCKTITIRQQDQPWTNSYTRLLLRKKNRNYRLFKQVNTQYLNAVNCPYTSNEFVTKLLFKKQRAFDKSRESDNQSKYANKRAKNIFFNCVNSTMNNPHISPKKNFLQFYLDS